MISLNTFHSCWAEVPVEQLNPLLKRQFVTGAQATFARMELIKGCFVPRHQHASEQIAHVTEGVVRFCMGEEGEIIKVARAGDILVIPGNLPHSVEAMENATILDAFSPPRHDWIRDDDAYLRR